MIKERLALKENAQHWNVLEVMTDYSLGGTNYFTHDYERRGYYLHVQPLEVHGNCETFTAFTGVKDLLKEVKRKSAKAEAEADRIAENTKQRYIDYILQKHGLELE